MMRVVSHWNRLPGEMVDAPDLEVAGKLGMDGLKGPFQLQTFCVSPCFCLQPRLCLLCLCHHCHVCCTKHKWVKAQLQSGGWFLDLASGSVLWEMLGNQQAGLAHPISKAAARTAGNLALRQATVGDLPKRDPFARSMGLELCLLFLLLRNTYRRWTAALR